MPHALLADAVLVLHALFIVWAVAGALAVWRWPGLAWLHLPAVAWAVWIEWSGGICPLTPLEWRLRELAVRDGGSSVVGRTTGQGERGFIEHYLTAAIYPDGLTRELQFALGAFVLLVNLGLYLKVLRRWRAGRSRIA